MSELIETLHVHDASPELGSLMSDDASPIPLSDDHGDRASPNAASMNDLEPRNFEQSSHVVRKVARINLLSEVFEFRNTSLDVG